MLCKPMPTAPVGFWNEPLVPFVPAPLFPAPEFFLPPCNGESETNITVLAKLLKALLVADNFMPARGVHATCAVHEASGGASPTDHAINHQPETSCDVPEARAEPYAPTWQEDTSRSFDFEMPESRFPTWRDVVVVNDLHRDYALLCRKMRITQDGSFRLQQTLRR